jgi:hypothetical protein
MVSMSRAIKLRLSAKLRGWLAGIVRQEGLSAEDVILRVLERAMRRQQGFLGHAGQIRGSCDLSSRKGFARK